MQGPSDFIAEWNEDHHALLYRCRWSSEDAERIVPGLIRGLSDDDRLLVDEALRALFLIGTPAVAAATRVTALIASPYSITRRLAVRAVAAIGGGSEAARELLALAENDRSKLVRTAVRNVS
ncbi:MAG: hypothetical protein JXB62_11895 [Pirellulales bacterium]|nr:hypothetical protein [Pirellulales bacterium]